MARQPKKVTGQKKASKSTATGKKPSAKAFQPPVFIKKLPKNATATRSEPDNKPPRKRTPKKQAELKQLLAVVNSTSSQARNMWLGFLGLITYLFVAIAGVSHADLLLNNLVKLPIVDVDIPLFSFFIAAPALFVLVHMGLLVQHALLSAKTQDFLVALDDGSVWGPGPDKMRGNLHAYTQTQLIAGPERSRFFGLFLNLMSWTTLYGLPVLLLLSFQVRFLPYHDERVTAGHAATLIIEILCVFVLGIFIARPSKSFFTSFIGTMRIKWLFAPLVAFSCLFAIYLSVFVLTVPDRYMESFRKVPPPRISWIFKPADWLTKFIFIANDGRPSKKTPVWKLSRNLVVTDIDLVLNKEDQHGEVSHRIRDRDLRYAALDRSDLHRVDFTDSDLAHVSAKETRFEKSIFERAQMQGAYLEEAQMQGANLKRARMQGANLERAQMQGVNLERVQMQEADLTEAEMQGADLRWAQMQGANLEWAQMQGANLEWAYMQGANLADAEMQGADLRAAEMQGADLRGTQMQGANLRRAQMQGADLEGAQMQGADLEGAQMQGAGLEWAEMQGANLEWAQIWQVTPVKSDQIKDADLRKLSLTPFYPDAARAVLAGLKQEAVRKRVEKRFAQLLDLDKVAAWAGSDDWKTWRYLKRASKSAPAVVAKILTDLACDDPSGGYITKGIARRILVIIEREQDYARRTAEKLTDSKTCRAAKYLSEETLARLRKIAERGTKKPPLQPSPEK